jgi:hypothetical protein
LHSTGSPEAAKSVEKTFSSDPELVKKFQEDFTKRATTISLIPKPTLITRSWRHGRLYGFRHGWFNHRHHRQHVVWHGSLRKSDLA